MVVNNLYIVINKLFTKKSIFLIILKIDIKLNENLYKALKDFYCTSCLVDNPHKISPNPHRAHP